MNSSNKNNLLACGQICLDCLRICSETISGCLSKGGKHAHVGQITVLMDCILVCETTANFLNRGSELSTKICEVCVEACERCAKSCEGWGDAEMDKCADECRSCAEGCRSMCGDDLL